MKATTLLPLIAAKTILHVSTIREGRFVVLAVKRAFVHRGQVFIDTHQGTVTFADSDVTEIETCVNNSVNVTVNGHREQYNLSW